MEHIVVGITGKSGAGKGSVVEYLVAHHGFKHYSLREFISSEVIRRGLPINRDTMSKVGTELRVLYGTEYISSSIMAEIQLHPSHAVIESIRSVADAKYLKSHGARIWAVEAELDERYRRIQLRGSETDHVSFDEFVDQENSERADGDPARMDTQGVVAIADVVIQNTGSLDELYKQVEIALTNALH